ncbi:MAG: Mammalian cell entry [Solirubrobacterales bacterium]|jgi:phospholipid/cholesterol/gamma-HCH transport system substrate-binding protein|nr:Mammalian cell entry [Solirubrobacterales bacterium]
MSRFSSDRLRLELRRSRLPAAQYLFLIACAAFAGTIIFKNQFYEKPWVAKRVYQVAFDDTKGVTPGVQRIRLAGVDVGVVRDAKLVDGRPVLTLSIEKSKGKIYADARMRLRPLTPLQDMFVDIESRGTEAAGELGDDQVLSARRTVSPVDVSRVLNTFDGTTRERMRLLLDDMGRGLEDNGAQLRASFEQLAPFLKAADRTTGVLKQRRQQVARVVTNLGKLTTALSERDEQLTSLVRDGNSTLAEISRVQDSFDSTLAQLPPLLSTMRTSFAALRTTEDELDPALADLRPVADKLEKGLEGLERFAVQATPAIASLEPAVKQLRPLADDLRPAARSLRSSLTALRPQVPKLDRMTDETVPCLPQIGNFFNNTISVLKFYDSYGTFPRGENTVDGNGLFGLGPAVNLRKLPSCTDGGRKP